MGFLGCKKCSAYYILNDGESPNDFSNICECGGEIKYYDYIPLNKVYIKCPRCGDEDISNRNYSFKPLGCFCGNCHNIIFIIDKCPICGYKHIILEKDNLNHPFLLKILYYSCPNCGNSFGFYNNIERAPITKDKFFMIRAVGMFITMLLAAILIFKKQFFP